MLNPLTTALVVFISCVTMHIFLHESIYLSFVAIKMVSSKIS